MLKKFLKPITLTNQVSLAIFLLRLGFAGLLATHGYDKLQSFLAGDHDFPDPLNVSPVVSHGLTVFAEFFCSLLLIMGLFTRLASAVLIICMLVIAFIVHGADPLGDKEQALLYFIGFLVIFLTGPGKYSLDARFYK
ncbi:DoxX family protein [Emticicia sp. C21]|uniref:DoxX family protein n=1 Tax=Emticicia sp. C21 TaxID=2302915 RepID=UPI000E347F2D|nr:DoxX family protein [Emticicia sp. C21]RFS18100.1 DoxX family protein [Emticicia sp. C21]